MNKLTLISGLAALFISLPSSAFLNLGSKSDNNIDTDSIKSLASSLTSQVTSQQDSPLVSALTSQLNLSPEQATGGAGALLALATNSLSGKQSDELSGLIPGMSKLQNAVPGLLGMADNMSSVTGIFNQLGLDSGMVSQFAPVLLQYLNGQGASSSLLSSLGSLWQ